LPLLARCLLLPAAPTWTAASSSRIVSATKSHSADRGCQHQEQASRSKAFGRPEEQKHNRPKSKMRTADSSMQSTTALAKSKPHTPLEYSISSLHRPCRKTARAMHAPRCSNRTTLSWFFLTVLLAPPNQWHNSWTEPFTLRHCDGTSHDACSLRAPTPSGHGIGLARAASTVTTLSELETHALVAHYHFARPDLAFTQDPQPKSITQTLEIATSESYLTKAEIWISSNFASGDMLTIEPFMCGGASCAVFGHYDGDSGKMTLVGQGTAAEYTSAIRDVRFYTNAYSRLDDRAMLTDGAASNLVVTKVVSIRTFDSDGTTESSTLTRNLQVRGAFRGCTEEFPMHVVGTGASSTGGGYP